MLKIKSNETESLEKELRIQQLLDEKQRIHNQWAEERRSLDHRVRLLEQDLRILQMGSNNALSSVFNENNHTNALNMLEFGNWNATYYPHQSTNGGYPRSNLFHGCPSAGSRSNSSGGNMLDSSAGELISTSAVEVNELNASGFNIGMLRQHSSAEFPTNTQSFMNDSTYARMEELRCKIVDRRSSVASGSSRSSVIVPNSFVDTYKISFDG